MTAEAQPESQPHLHRRFGLVQSTALNMSNMVGMGPFITIPLLMSSMGGPQAMLGWLVAVLIAIPDGLVWSELGAMMPGSGGSYVYLREGFGRQTVGRLMAFLFIWQFIFSGPLEIASGYIGVANYAKYVMGDVPQWQTLLLVTLLGAANIFLLYRKITSVARLTVFLWIGTILTTGIVIVTGLTHFDSKIAFDFPPDSFRFSYGFLMGLGAAATVGIYDYLGYYDICYIGDEVRDPGRVIPRSILMSLVVVALLYLGINLAIIGVIPWREFVPKEQHPESAFIVSILIERVWGADFARLFTGMIVWTAVGSVFALLLGYPRIPYAAAKDGYFFPVFSRLHQTKDFPHVSLLVVGVVAIVASFFPLDDVIGTLITTRILVQFIGQIVALSLLRHREPGRPRPFRMWLYPLPSLLALIGWTFLFVTSKPQYIIFGLGTLAAGIVFFLIWSRKTGRWPFPGEAPSPAGGPAGP